MSHTIPAIFEAGVFRPLQRVELAEGTQVEVQMPVGSGREVKDELSSEALASQQKEIAEMLAEIESLPIREPDDGFSGVDFHLLKFDFPLAGKLGD